MHKEKCGILTINISLMNYGNRLQNYALQQVLKGWGYDVYTVNYKPTYPELSYPSLRSATFEVKKDKLYDTIELIRRRLLYFRNRKKQREKKEKFNEFIHNYISWTSKDYNIHSDLSSLDCEFDWIIAGSDQIWNPYWEGTQPIYFMQFVPERKRIAYAASFGVSKIPEDMKQLYKIYLRGIPNISCRENVGCDLVEQLIGKRPIQVLDPVFLIEKSSWARIEDKPKGVIINRPYILVYFLGEMTKDNIIRIKEIQKAHGCSLIFLDQRDRLNSYFASPTEFLYLVHHARLVCTDSFHGSAFSVIYNKPFAYFQRALTNGAAQNMSSRLTSLFELFQCNRDISVLNNQEVGNMNYEKINKILIKEKERSYSYLHSILEK